MNIFEILHQEESLNPYIFNGILQFQTHWLNFKSIVDHVFTEETFNSTLHQCFGILMFSYFIEEQTVELWNDIFNNSKQLIRVIIDYYFQELDTIFFNKYIQEYKQIYSLQRRAFDPAHFIKALEYIGGK